MVTFCLRAFNGRGGGAGACSCSNCARISAGSTASDCLAVKIGLSLGSSSIGLGGASTLSGSFSALDPGSYTFKVYYLAGNALEVPFRVSAAAATSVGASVGAFEPITPGNENVRVAETVPSTLRLSEPEAWFAARPAASGNRLPVPQRKAGRGRERVFGSWE